MTTRVPYKPAPKSAATKKRCSRCGSSDAPRPLPKRFACSTCGPRLLCFGCDISHNAWCGVVAVA